MHMPNAPFAVIEVSKAELRSIFATPAKFATHFTEDKFDKQWVGVRDALRRALSRHWKEGFHAGDDFMVSDDRNHAWTQCGGVYTPRVCCPEYVLTILRVLAGVPNSDKWAYHTAVEVVWRPEDAYPVTPPYASGGFVIKSGQMFVPKDGYDYSRFYVSGRPA
jgi:hypothetical protein